MTAGIDVTCIPQALARRAQWVVWRTEPREEGGKPTKVPYQARYPDRKASSNGERTWAKIDIAIKTYERGGFDGIGYVFAPDDPFFGFDFDNCLDDQGYVAPWVQAWLDQLDTYIEISPSGRGLKGIAIGTLPGSGVNAKIIEVYNQGRYFAITGRRWPGKPNEPREVNGIGDKLYAFAQQHKAKMDAERELKRQRAYAEKALENEVDRVRSATEGIRNDQLNRSAFALAGFTAILGDDTIERALTDAAKAAGLGDAEIRETLRSGTRAGKADPRSIPPPRDTRTEYLPAPAEQPESVLLIERLKVLGYTFRLNLCTDTIEVNNHPLDEIVMAEVRMRMRDIGLAKKLKATEDAYMYAARQDAYHPIRDYLNSLKWDGEDHIGVFTGHLDSDDPPVVYSDGTAMPLHHVYFYRWIIGAVAKVFTGTQNAMLVLDGPQNIGKSTLAHWLCPLPAFFIEGAINVADKDSDIRLLSHWIWEVSELDATTRKADQSAIKAFVTKEVVTVRKSYGRSDIKKPAMASLIGTVNNTSGFLADESGSRRFLITRIKAIDWAYQRLDCHQLWAQAMALYTQGQKWQLQRDELAIQQVQNNRYEVSSLLDDYVDKYFMFDPSFVNPISMADMLAEFAKHDIKLSGSERGQAMELARVLTRRGAQKIHTRTGNHWMGIGIIPS